MADLPPPSYEQATGSSTSSRPAASSTSNHNATSSHLNVPGKGGMPDAHRRSMEDEARPLPTGWVRSYDPQNQHQFFVDTTKDPPKSIWHHPYDDEEYINSLSGEERERVEQESINYKKMDHTPSKDDYIHAHSDDEDDYLPQHYQNQASSASGSSNAQLPPRPDGKDGKGKGKVSFGRKVKDKVTGMTHEEREAERRAREEEERRAYESHLKIRQAMQRAAETGQPQHIGKDREGKDIYIEPPRPPYQGGGYNGYGYNPYSPYNSQGIYTTPNARYVRPGMPYGRPYGSPYGYGRPYGGGMGMPLAGGLLGGALLGGLLF
ncbi:hypothetical protein Slin15195_G123530 [Septoria linicola]|uniref:WW domain-containing protein n=1 Tax=Septoria linicola TaxID=215465 RepID=A0A9Q9B170_9PEZI|nr:hypothetical protein Slin14017_G079730 [Septoria linicola]USW59034.1 hypothetical protein Slin15195_G123530 [Septoria linicola]